MSTTTHPTPGFTQVPAHSSREMTRRALVACGIAYALLYVAATDVIAAALYPGYSRMAQAISELSSVGAPSKRFLTTLAPVQGILLIAFGIGVWLSARGVRALRVAGGIVFAQGALGFLWLLAPMSQREDIARQGGTLADAMHIALSAAMLVSIVGSIAASAMAFGRRFRVYAIASIAVLLGAGAATFAMSTRLSAGVPTPWLGLVERIMLGAWLLWMAVLAIALRRDRGAQARPS